MKREELIKKWLDNELSSQEKSAFEALEDHDDLLLLAERVQRFAPEGTFDTEALLTKLQASTKQKATKVKPLYLLTRIAAVFLVLIGIYFTSTFFSKTTEVTTLIAQKESVKLPDNSLVQLNAVSSITYDPSTWDETREVALKGEAYFQVAKGATFQVKTSKGVVTVLGTEFNVRYRDDIFEVACYEGSVKVRTEDQELVLGPGDRFRESATTAIPLLQTQDSIPSWTRNESSFTSAPFLSVIQELERHYDVNVIIDASTENELFTGGFTHTNLEVALQSLSTPFNLSYTQQENTVTLSRD